MLLLQSHSELENRVAFSLQTLQTAPLGPICDHSLPSSSPGSNSPLEQLSAQLQLVPTATPTVLCTLRGSQQQLLTLVLCPCEQ